MREGVEQGCYSGMMGEEGVIILCSRTGAQEKGPLPVLGGEKGKTGFLEGGYEEHPYRVCLGGENFYIRKGTHGGEGVKRGGRPTAIHL